MRLLSALTAFLALAATAALADKLPDWWVPKDATPGVEFSIIEVERHDRDPAHGRPSVTTRLSASGYPRGVEYEIWTSWLDQRHDKIIDLIVAEDGALHFLAPDTGKPAGDLGKLIFTLDRYVLGEPTRMALTSKDKSIRAFASFVPFPYAAEHNGCRLTLEMLAPDASAYLALGEGFRPGETVTTLSRSDGERIEGTAVVDDKGAFGPGVLFPATVTGGGKASYRVTGADCSVEVKYKWGKAGRKNYPRPK